MSAPKGTPSEKAPAKPTAEKAASPEKSEPEVELHPTYKVGQEVIHDSGKKYKVRAVHETGIALEGVANLIDPRALKPA